MNKSPKKNKTKAVVLLSGGLDSATVLFDAKARGYQPYALTFSYGQRHSKETRQAVKIAAAAQCPCTIIPIALPWGGSSLLDKKQKLPKRSVIDPEKIPTTYVPGRNTIFLSFALSYAEAIGARAVFIGANALDYSGYPDCRPKYFLAWEKVATLGTKVGIKGKPITIEVPLLQMTKAQIIKYGSKLGVPYRLTWSCYQGGRRPCGRCDSCRLRRRGFEEAGVVDGV